MDDKEKQKLGMEERYYTFKKVKEMYNQGNVFGRFSRKIKGNSPDWDKIEDYDLETLEYLVDVRKGDTFEQKESLKRHEDRVYDSKGKIAPYTEEELRKKRFDKFASKLMKSEPELKKEIEIDKQRAIDSFEKYGRNIYR